VFFVRGDPHDKAPFSSQVPDWSRAGIGRICRGFVSALALPIEDVLPRVGAYVTIIRTEYDMLTTHGYAAWLAETNGARLVLMPGAGHSWPKADSARFLRFIEELAAQ
jgi:pimeloyl-ACP methyl ester carboxylesterase